MEILFRLRTSKRDKSLGTLYCRVTVNGVRAPEKSLSIRIPKKDWDSKRQKVTPNNESSQISNARLTQVRQDFDAAYLELRKADESILLSECTQDAIRNCGFSTGPYID